jgi:RNA polymerase-binding transcription factor DksA
VVSENAAKVCGRELWNLLPKPKTPKKPVVRKSPAKKVVAKKAAPVKKAVAKKPVAKKAAPAKAKKVVAKKAAPTKKVVAKSAPVKKAVAAKPVVAKKVTKPVVAKKVVTPAKPVVAKKVVASAKPVVAKKVVAPAKPVVAKPVLAPVVKAAPAPAPVQKPVAKPSNEKTRYSDAELEEFRTLITFKLENARTELVNLQAQIINANENGTDDTGSSFKMLEDGSDTLAKEEAANLAARQKKFIEQLEAALIRIKNKTYGVCRVTGKLIPKERLRAVPHTTQSMEAKLQQYKD